MKLSECYLGRVVQDKQYPYEEVMDHLAFGHVDGFVYWEGQLKVRVNTPLTSRHFRASELKPMED
jgi:hypothetical protein